MKKVTVIIPTYKRSDYLLRAINSVLNQTYSNIEIIIVDDNDEDSEYRTKNEEKLKDLINDDKIIYLKHKNNMNGAVARNTGIKKATGDYITFLDDDDFFLKNRINELVEVLEENDDYDAAYTSMIKTRNNKFINYRIPDNKNKEEQVLRHYSFFGTGSNMFFRKSIIKKIGLFDESFNRFQDLEYMLRFLQVGKIIGINKVLVVKCEEDKINVPNFEKMKFTMNLFIEKFEDIINSYSGQINDIKYNIFKGLYIFSIGKEHTSSKEILRKYSNIKIKDRFLYLYVMLLYKFKIFKYFDYIIRRIRLIGKLSNDEKQEINSILLDKGNDGV